MSILFVDGFDKYAADTDYALKGWGVGSLAATAHNSSGGRFGGGALEVGNTSISHAVPGNPATVIVSWSFKVSALPTTERNICALVSSSGSNQNCQLRLTTTGAIKIFGGSGLTNISGAPIVQAGQWCRIELKATISNSGAWEIRINGATYNSGTNDLYATGNLDVATLFIDGSADYTLTVDDVVIQDTAGSAPGNTFLGDLSIETLTPTAEGDASDFTPSAGADNALMVDETVADDDTTHVESATVNHEDLHAHSDLSATPESVIAAVVNIRAKDQGGVGRGLKASVKSSTTTARSAEFTLSGGYAHYQGVFEQDPDTAAAWTGAGIDAAQFGYQISS